MTVRRCNLIALALLGLCVSPLVSFAPPGSGLQSYAPVAAQAPGTARVWFVHTKEPQEQLGDPIIYANGRQVGRSVAGIARYHDFPPGTYTSTVQSYGLTAGQPLQKDVVRLAPGTQTYLEALWGGSGGWVAREVRPTLCTLPPSLGPANVDMPAGLRVRPRPCSPATGAAGSRRT
jgi:hypothetical protein